MENIGNGMNGRITYLNCNRINNFSDHLPIINMKIGYFGKYVKV